MEQSTEQCLMQAMVPEQWFLRGGKGAISISSILICEMLEACKECCQYLQILMNIFVCGGWSTRAVGAQRFQGECQATITHKQTHTGKSQSHTFFPVPHTYFTLLAWNCHHSLFKENPDNVLANTCCTPVCLCHPMVFSGEDLGPLLKCNCGIHCGAGKALRSLFKVFIP